VTRSDESTGPLGFLTNALRHRRLIGRMAWRGVESRYRGSALGLLWAVVQPLLMLGVYTFVFGVVFQNRWNLPGSEPSHFAIYLLSGLILFGIFADCANQAPALIRQNSTYVTQVPFPIDVLSWVSLLEALVAASFGAAILVLGYAVVIGPPPLTALFLPLVALPIVLLALGASWFLSSLGVYLEDISQVVSVGTTALLFLSPIFYSPDNIPEAFRTVYFLNPLAHLLEMSKDCLFQGLAPEWGRLAALGAGSFVFAWLGHRWFVRSQEGFADVL
jgi:lipopolysaccharide transport system permease protein